MNNMKFYISLCLSILVQSDQGFKSMNRSEQIFFELELELEHSLFDKYKYTTCMAKNTWLEKLYKYSRETKAEVQEYRYH